MKKFIDDVTNEASAILKPLSDDQRRVTIDLLATISSANLTPHEAVEVLEKTLRSVRIMATAVEKNGSTYGQ